MRKLRVALILAASIGCFVADRSTRGYGVLNLEIVDHDTNAVVPARITLRDSSGTDIVPETALPIFDDCGGKIPFHNWLPAAAAPQTRWGERRGIRNPFRGSTDFYTTGTLKLELRPGRYWIRVEKGPEYRQSAAEFAIAARREERQQLILHRWADLPAQGWYSSDDHLHIPRPSARFDPALATWMQAEDIHVANLLQMGMARDVHITPQRAFGPQSVYQAGGTLLVGGQENPRTHVLGHNIILGGRSWVDFPQAYLLYDRAWREAHRQGALAGFAHFAMAGGQDGLAIWAPERLLDFIEVLNIGFPYYQSWYDALNLGLRIVPTAGTDYPCVAVLPGRERFYAKLNGSLTLANWLEAVRRGRTFVTNGPIIQLTAEGAEIGEEVALAAPRAVRAQARVRFDPARERVDRLELIQAGEVIATARGSNGSGEIAIDTAVSVSASTWLAARAWGEKIGERPAASVEPFVQYVLKLRRKADAHFRETLEQAGRPRRTRESAAHTAPIYVQVQGTPPIAEQPRARQVALAWLDLLEDLTTRLDDAHLAAIAGFPGTGDGLTLDDLRRNRAGLLAAIDKARAHYRLR